LQKTKVAHFVDHTTPKAVIPNFLVEMWKGIMPRIPMLGANPGVSRVAR
jgi:hypothetical protein